MSVLSILVATTNRAKIAAIKGLLGGLPVEVIPAHEALGAAMPNIIEDGDTFEENALKKAREIAGVSMMITLADDSGLEVGALGGRPGVRSQRFAGEGATDAENNAELLRSMEEIDDRGARFRHAMALVDPWSGFEEVVAGSCSGSIARSPSGTGGFGYDALFVIDDGRTLADLTDLERLDVSHRGKAIKLLEPRLILLIANRLEDAAAIVSGTYLSPASRTLD